MVLLFALLDPTTCHPSSPKAFISEVNVTSLMNSEVYSNCFGPWFAAGGVQPMRIPVVKMTANIDFFMMLKFGMKFSSIDRVEFP